jgi:hypothetical protein
VSWPIPELTGIDWTHVAIEAGAGVLGYLLLILCNPVARFFRDGLAIVNRHPRIWIWLAILSCSYSIFQAVIAWRLGEFHLSLYDLVNWPTARAVDLNLAAQRCWLPALELLSGLFNQVVVSFPASGLAAILFLMNWGGAHFNLIAEARVRLGIWWMPVYLGVVICAFAAVAKPLFAISIHWLNQFFDGLFLLRVGAVLDWLSFQFEYLFGLVVQIYLILLAFVWIRGIKSDPERVFALALRRTPHVAKWAGLMLLISALFIHLPLLISYLWIGQFTDFTSAAVEYVDQTVRPLFAMVLIFFCSVQITLVLHNQTLQKALQEHANLMRTSWYRLLWFVIVAGLHLYAVCWVGEVALACYPNMSAPNVLASLLVSFAKGVVAAWLLTSWVCLYRDARRPRKEIRF